MQSDRGMSKATRSQKHILLALRADFLDRRMVPIGGASGAASGAQEGDAVRSEVYDRGRVGEGTLMHFVFADALVLPGE
eukprot:8391908-Pyramimonas_sp.AAC.1